MSTKTPKETPADTARRLPPPVPGQVVVVPLLALIEYYYLHRLEPVSYNKEVMTVKREQKG